MNEEELRSFHISQFHSHKFNNLILLRDCCAPTGNWKSLRSIATHFASIFRIEWNCVVTVIMIVGWKLCPATNKWIWRLRSGALWKVAQMRIQFFSLFTAIAAMTHFRWKITKKCNFIGMSHKALDHAKWVSISQQQSLHSSSSSISDEKDFVFQKQKHQIQTKLMEFHLFSAILLFFSFFILHIYLELWCVSGNLREFDAGICREYDS